MWAVASLFRQFAHTNVHGTDSVNIENSPRYTDIFVQCIVMSMSRVSVCIHISWTACLKSSHWMFPLIMMATLLHSSSASSMWWVVADSSVETSRWTPRAPCPRRTASTPGPTRLMVHPSEPLVDLPACSACTSADNTHTIQCITESVKCDSVQSATSTKQMFVVSTKQIDVWL